MSINASHSKHLFAIVATGLLFPPFLVHYLKPQNVFVVRRSVFAMLGVIYGFTLKLGPNADGTRHFERAELYYSGMTLKTFIVELGQIFSLQGTRAQVFDPFVHLISYLTGSVLGAPSLFFPVVGLIFGWYFGGAVLLAVERFHIKSVNYVILFFLTLLLFLRGINEIQAVRMWTAMWMMLFAIMYWSKTRNATALFAFLMAPLVHFSYFIICPVAAAFWFLRRRRQALAITFFVTTAISLPINITEFGTVESTGLFETRSSYIVDQDTGSAIVDARNNPMPSGAWYARYIRLGGIDYAFTLFAATLIVSGFYSKVRGWRAHIISIGIGLMVFSNLAAFVPALAGRSNLIAGNILLLGFIAARLSAMEHGRTFVKRPEIYKLGIHLSMLALLPVLLFALSSNTEGVSYLMVTAPLAAIAFPEINMSIKELVNWLI